MTVKLHYLRDLDMGDAYDRTQVDDTIRNGDILLVKDGVAVMDVAWPTMIVGESTVFHNFNATPEGKAGKARALGMYRRLTEGSCSFDLLTSEELDEFRVDNGYRSMRRLPDGSWAILMDLIFTRAICLGADQINAYKRRYCFENRAWADREFSLLESETDEPEGYTARRPQPHQEKELGS